MIFPDASPEEALAAVAGGGSVVLAGGTVPADGAVLRQRCRRRRTRLAATRLQLHIAVWNKREINFRYTYGKIEYTLLYTEVLT